MTGTVIRRAAFGLAAALCVACWLAVLAAWAFLDPGLTLWTVLVTAAALSTEALFWVGAATLGWSVFANRARLLRRLTGARA